MNGRLRSLRMSRQEGSKADRAGYGGSASIRVIAVWLDGESMQSRGDSCCGSGFNIAIDGAEVGIASSERTLKRAVQDGRTDVKE